MSSDQPPLLDVLPAELVTRIFVHALPTLPEPPSPHTAPLLLTQVCREWREIALGSPELWTHITLHDVDEKSLKMRQVWAERAGAVPLEYSITAKDGAGGVKMLELAREHRARLASLHVDAPPATFFNGRIRLRTPLLVASPTTPPFYPALRRVHLQLDYILSPLGDLDFRNAPALRELRVDLRIAHCAALPAPWSQLTSLCGSRLRLPLQTLKMCTALVELDLSNYYLSASDPTQSPAYEDYRALITLRQSIRLEQLERLKLDDTSLMQYLILPRLRSLSLHSNMTLGRDVVDDLANAATSWGCSVQHVELVVWGSLAPMRGFLGSTLCATLESLHLDLKWAGPTSAPRIDEDVLSLTVQTLLDEGDGALRRLQSIVLDLGPEPEYVDVTRSVTQLLCGRLGRGDILSGLFNIRLLVGNASMPRKEDLAELVAKNGFTMEIYGRDGRLLFIP
ncbi:hypothetical protein MKEN_00630300 [Mycena kentingensis (nom. inval.)]|nr:hypothetical protein MKEN_00630300 [Mycena kentingensis (nom. inval.)]